MYILKFIPVMGTDLWSSLFYNTCETEWDKAGSGEMLYVYFKDYTCHGN